MQSSEHHRAVDLHPPTYDRIVFIRVIIGDSIDGCQKAEWRYFVHVI